VNSQQFFLPGTEPVLAEEQSSDHCLRSPRSLETLQLIKDAIFCETVLRRGKRFSRQYSDLAMVYVIVLIVPAS
jgi:hypothetical protein